MKFDPEKHHRQSMRLKEYDYSQEGLYFITICTQDRECLFGEITNGEMMLNEFGQIANDEWIKSGEIRSEITIDCFVIMPNHIHGIIQIHGTRRGDRPVAPTANGPKPKSIGAFVAGYKSAVTTQINILRKTKGNPVWQRNYYEHIIRNPQSYQKISDYIINNPANWQEDKFYKA